MTTKAYCEGYNAFYDDVDCNQNPYNNTTQEYTDWLNGWMSARDVAQIVAGYYATK